jgi:hypothetical protein
MVEACRIVVLQRLARLMGKGLCCECSSTLSASTWKEQCVVITGSQSTTSFHLYTKIPSYISCFGLTYIVSQA